MKFWVFRAYLTIWNNLSVVTKMGELFAMFVVKIFRDYSGRYSSWRTWTNLIVATLKAFSKVIHACFGKEADPNYREIISDFENCWFDIFIEFDIAFTNKAHVIISHVPQVIARTGRRLFFQSVNPPKIWNILEAVQSPGCWEWTAWSKFVGMYARLQYQKHIMGKNKSIVESLNLSSFTIFVLMSHWTVHIYFSQIWRILRPPPAGCLPCDMTTDQS